MYYRAILPLIAASALSACAPNPCFLTTVPVEDVPRFETGCTREQLLESLRGATYWQYRNARCGTEITKFRASIDKPLTHQFTVFHDGDIVLCVTARVIHPKFLFLFVNNRLAGVYQPKFVYRDRESLTEAIDRYSLVRRLTADEFVQYVEKITDLDRESLDEVFYRYSLARPWTTDKFVQYVKEYTEAANRPSRYSEPNPVLAIELPFRWGSERRVLKRQAAFQAKYDAVNLTLGMSSASIEEMFGAPVLVEDGPNGESVRVYGTGSARKHMPHALVSVTYAEDVCVAIRSHDFVSDSHRLAAFEALGGERR